MKGATSKAEPAGRGSLEGWLNAAYESLTESGVDAVRVMPLAKKLNLSRTSFYWFFEDRDALLVALIEQWKNKNTFNLVTQSQAYAESITEAILNVFDCWLNSELFDSQFEFAMRSWRCSHRKWRRKSARQTRSASRHCGRCLTVSALKTMLRSPAPVRSTLRKSVTSA